MKTIYSNGYARQEYLTRKVNRPCVDWPFYCTVERLVAANVDEVTAEQNACRIEHTISDTSFEKLKKKIGKAD